MPLVLPTMVRVSVRFFSVERFDEECLVARSRKLRQFGVEALALHGHHVGAVVRILDDGVAVARFQRLERNLLAVGIDEAEILGAEVLRDVDHQFGDLGAGLRQGVPRHHGDIVLGVIRHIDRAGNIGKGLLHDAGADFVGLAVAEEHVLRHHIAAAAADGVVAVVLQELVPRLVEETARIGRAGHRGKTGHRLGIVAEQALGAVVDLLHVHAGGGDPAEQHRGGAFGVVIAHFADGQRQILGGGFNHALLEVGEGAVEYVGLAFERLGAILDHAHFADVRAGGVVTAGPEAVLGGPFAVLLLQCLQGTGGHVFLVVVELGAGITHVDFVELAVGQTERPAAVVPMRETCVFVFAVEISRALHDIPDVVARALGQARPDDLGAVGRLPAELGVRRDVGVDAAIERGERNAEALVELRHLRDLPPAERRIAGLADTTEFLGLAVAQQQVADERFTTDAKLVGQHEPRTNQETAFLDELDHLLAAFRTDFEIILQRDRLRVHVE